MTALNGKRVLIVEDEPIVAMALEDILESFGCTIVGPAATLAAGLSLAETSPVDAAMLDVNLSGEESFPIAAILDGRAIPYAFTTGYGAEGLSGRSTARVIAKPYRPAQIRDALASMLT